MLKSVVVHDIDMDGVAAMERWYWSRHAPEINRRFGPWLVRHDSYHPVDAPVDARAHGWFNWRVTEGHWREMPLEGPRGNLAFTVPPQWPRVATGFFPAQPTDDICGGGLQPGERQVLRWYCLVRWPESCPVAEAERWFLEVHARELAALGNPWRAFSTRAHEGRVPLPGEWPADAHPPRESVGLGWHRLTELWFQSFAEWRNFMTTSARLTPPPWARAGDAYPWLRPGTGIASTFLLERPSDEFARDARGYL